MPTTVIFKFGVGDRVLVLVDPDDKPTAGEVRVLHCVGKLGNSYDVRVGRGVGRYFMNNVAEQYLSQNSRRSR